MSRRKLLLPLLAGLIAFLTVAGGGTAYALWSAHAQAGLTASSASIGVAATGTSASAGLAIGYNQADNVYANAGAITITNTGSREAWYELVVATNAASVTDLPQAIHVGVRVVSSAAGCTTTSLPAPTLGGGALSWVSTGFSPVKIPASGTVTLCVETWLPESEISPLGSTWIDLRISTRLTYTDPAATPNPAWTADGDFDPATPGAQPLIVHQTVTTRDLALLFENPVGRYWVSSVSADSGGTLVNQGFVCKNGGNDRPARYDGSTACTGDAYNSQWRLVPVPGEANAWWILQAINSYTQPTTPRWTVTGLGDTITDQSPDNSNQNQKWVIEGRGDGTYRIKSLGATTGTGAPVCVTIGAAYWSGVSSLVPAACDGTAALQGFRFQLIGNPVPSTVLDSNGDEIYPNGYPITCGGNLYYRTMSWPASTSYESEVHYRIYFDDTLMLEYANGYATTASIGDPTAAATQTWWAAHAGNAFQATAQVTIQQQITDIGPWASITQPLTVWVQHYGTSNNQVSCTQPAAPFPSSPVAATCKSGTSHWSVNWSKNGTYQSISQYRVLIDSTVIASVGSTTSYSGSAQTAPIPSLVGARTLTVQVSLAGTRWETYTTQPVTVTSTGGTNPAYGVTC